MYVGARARVARVRFSVRFYVCFAMFWIGARAWVARVGVVHVHGLHVSGGATRGLHVYVGATRGLHVYVGARARLARVCWRMRTV